jgi:hypothetical protein
VRNCACTTSSLFHRTSAYALFCRCTHVMAASVTATSLDVFSCQPANVVAALVVTPCRPHCHSAVCSLPMQSLLWCLCLRSASLSGPCSNVGTAQPMYHVFSKLLAAMRKCHACVNIDLYLMLQLLHYPKLLPWTKRITEKSFTAMPDGRSIKAASHPFMYDTMPCYT